MRSALILKTLLLKNAGVSFPSANYSLWGDNQTDQNGNLNRFESQQTARRIDGGHVIPAPKHGAGDLASHYLGSVSGVKDLASDYTAAMGRGHLGAVAATGASTLLAAILTHNLLKKRSKR